MKRIFGADLEKRISALETRVGKKKKEDNWFSLLWGHSERSLTEDVVALRDDMKELQKKLCALERYLQLEFVKRDEETHTYDWKDKKHVEEFRKAPMSYEKMKEAKKEEE